MQNINLCHWRFLSWFYASLPCGWRVMGFSCSSRLSQKSYWWTIYSAPVGGLSHDLWKVNQSSKHPGSCQMNYHIWVFPKIGVPQNGWFIMENPIKMGWFGGTHIFGNFWKHLFHPRGFSWNSHGLLLLFPCCLRGPVREVVIIWVDSTTNQSPWFSFQLINDRTSCLAWRILSS